MDWALVRLFGLCVRYLGVRVGCVWWMVLFVWYLMFWVLCVVLVSMFWVVIVVVW